MSGLRVYTYANCDTCRRAVRWLGARGVEFTEKPIRETPPTKPELRRMAAALGERRRLFNTAGRDYRALGLAEKLAQLSDAEALALLAGNGNLVKRPFLIGRKWRWLDSTRRCGPRPCRNERGARRAIDWAEGKIHCNFWRWSGFSRQAPMKTLLTLLTAGLLLAVPNFAEAKINRIVEKTFAVQPGVALKVQTSGGDIKVVSSDGSEVKVTARQLIKADSDTKADEILRDLQLTIEQIGNQVTATAKYGKTGWNWGSSPVTVSFTVAVPRQCEVDLNTSGGDIALDSIKGRARLRTSGGDLKIDRVDGEVDGGTSGGNITLNEGTAKVNLSTSGGNITVNRAGGETELSTSGGSIVVGAVLTRLNASTSGGDITANLDGPLQADCSLSTSGGDVIVTVSKTAAFALKAQTSGGNVDADGLTIAIEKGGLRKSSLAGKVNGGGARLSLGTSGGDIRIRSR